MSDLKKITQVDDVDIDEVLASFATVSSIFSYNEYTQNSRFL